MSTLPEEDTFDRDVARLESIATHLSEEGLPLERATTLFEEGVALSRDLQRRLREMEHRVERAIAAVDPDATDPDDREA